ncbi:MAG: hypothetical protein KKA42_05645, partial [candidate division Zixibacteria bacterium]|nr:hypothetical protein [candidate division Zixibacteria bacterium]
MKKKLIIFVFLRLFTATVYGDEEATLTFDHSTEMTAESAEISRSIAIGKDFTLPATSFLVALQDHESVADITSVVGTSHRTGTIDAALVADGITAHNDTYGAKITALSANDRLGSSVVRVLGE